MLLPCSVAYGQGQPEILNPSLSKLNSVVSTSTTKQKLLAQLGQPTRIETAHFECGLTDAQAKAKVQKLYYYGKTMFYVFDGNAELIDIDFRSGKFTYKTPKITLTNKVTFADIEKLYPKAAKAATKEKRGKMLIIRPCETCDDTLNLYFENEKLTQLEFWEPC